MALISCSECGRQISDKAVSCPSCGNPLAGLNNAVINTSADVFTSTPVASKPHSLGEGAFNWGIMVAVVALAFILNPSAQAHRAKIRDTMADRHPIASVFGIGHLVALDVNYHSLVGLASYTESSNQIVTVGAYGVVFVVAR